MKLDKGNDVAHALIFSQKATPISFDAGWSKWTPTCLSQMKAIKEQAVNNYRAKSNNQYADLSIPSSSLRMLLQLKINELLSTTTYTGFSHSDMNYMNTIKPFALMKNASTIEKNLSACVEKWLDKHVSGFIERHEVSDHMREELYSLFDDKTLFEIGHKSFQLFPWTQHNNGTAKPQDNSFSYPIAATDIARLLEGKILFPGLPPVMRIVTEQGQRAELVTPIIDSYEQGRFSMVCSISIETLPTVNYPLIYINFHRRRWVDNLSSRYTHSLTKSAYLIHPGENRAYQFKFYKRPNENNDWVWTADDAWDVLSDKYQLTRSHQAEDLLSLSNSSDISIGVAHEHGIEDKQSKNRLGAGVTETDRINAFMQVESALSEYGFERFTQFSIIKNPTSIFTGLAYLDARTLMDRDDADSDTITNDTEADQSYTIMTDQDIDQAFTQLDQEFQDVMHNIIADQDINKLQERRNKVESMLTLNQTIVNASFSNGDNKPTLVLISQDQSQQGLLLTITQRLFGDSLNIKTALLPANTHGPKSELPDSQLKDSERLQTRKQVWELFVKQNLSDQPNVMCLVQANEYYVVANKSNQVHDDKVNKAAAKITMASEAGIPTQYLKPINKNKKTKEKQLTDYIHRAQSALLDLVFGHHGLVPGISDQISKSFTDTDTIPNYIYGISVIKVNKKTLKFGRNNSSELAVATRIDSRTGIPEVKLCHFDNDLHITSWLSFNESIRYITKRYNNALSIGNYKGAHSRPNNFQAFTCEIYDEADSHHGCVFVDSNHAKLLWSGLTDTGVSNTQFVFSNNTKKSWDNVRIIRVRHQAPPLMIEKFKAQYAVHTTCPRLFRLATGDVPIYWSLGHPLVKIKRGVSTYQETQIPDKDDNPQTRAPWLKPAPTPNAVEFTILSKPDSDDPDDLASFASALRRGVLQANIEKWVRAPVPLFITKKLEEYLGL